MYTVTVNTFNPVLAKLIRLNIEQYLTELDREAKDASMKRSASFAVGNVKVERV